MYLEAVTICVNYADILAVTLPSILACVDRLVVVTDLRDERTQNLCAYYAADGRLTCVQTDAFYEHGARFNKGAGINAGLEKLVLSDWVLHLDSDIYLPPGLRQMLAGRELDKRALYGLDRLMCLSYADWARFVLEPGLLHHKGCLVRPGAYPAFALGERVVHYGTTQGYYPCGYFQLWNAKAVSVFTYPADSAGADHSDIDFGRAWSAARRVLLPDALVVHLDSERSAQGSNWYGRNTAPFVPAELAQECTYAPAVPLDKLNDLLAESESQFAVDHEQRPA